MPFPPLPPNDPIVGQTGHTVDHDTIHDWMEYSESAISAKLSTVTSFSHYLLSTSTTGDPGTGHLAIDTPTVPSNATTLRISKTSSDGATYNLAASRAGDSIIFNDPTTQNLWVRDELGQYTDQGTYLNFNLRGVTAGTTAFVAETKMDLLISPLKAQTADSASAGWTFSNATADADPGGGRFRLNNADRDAVTFIYFDDLDVSNVDQSSRLLNGQVDDTIYVQKADDAASKVTYKVTGAPVDAAGYVKVPVIVSVAAAGAEFVNNQDCLFVFKKANLWRKL